MFLRNTPYACLFNNESGAYAVFYRLDTDRFIWIFPSSGGNVTVALLDIPECEKEIKNWGYVTEPPMGKAPRCTDAQPFTPKVLSLRHFGAFTMLISKNKSKYEFLFKNSMDIYKDILSPAWELPKRAVKNGASAVLRIDYKTCTYDSLNSAIPGGSFTYRCEKQDFHVSAPDAGLDGELTFQFRECFYPYIAFIENPMGFIRRFPYSSLFDKTSGDYALCAAGGKNLYDVWLFLKKDGRVLSSTLATPEAKAEAAKREYIVIPPGPDNIKIPPGKSYVPKVISFEMFVPFLKFIDTQKNNYESLYNYIAEKYKGSVSLPDRTPAVSNSDELLFAAPRE
jgi:hypothetical protein